MGKGNRSRRETAQKRQVAQEQQQVLYLQQKKKRRGTLWLTVAVAVAVVGLTVGLIAGAVDRNSGHSLRRRAALESEHYTVSGTMMSYYIANYAAAFADTYADELALIGLDTTVKLKSQFYDETQTWFSYFAKSAADYASEFLYIAEEAARAGYALSRDGLDSIEENLAEMKSYAEQSGISLDEFLSATFGPGVKEQDVRAALELSLLAEEYTAILREENTLNDRQLQAYYEEHRADYERVTLLRFTLSYIDNEIAPADAQAIAETLAATDSETTFKETLSAWLTDWYFPVCLNEPISDSAINRIVNNLSTDMTYSDKDAVSRWAFSTDRQVGDTYITSDGASHTVYMLTATAVPDMTPSRNLCQFLFSLDVHNTEKAAIEVAQAMLDDFISGALSVERFDAAANAHSQNGIEGTCLVRNCPTGLLPASLEDWLYDEAREIGDVGLVTTVYGVHVVYYEGDGIPQYLAALADTILTDRMDAALSALAKRYPVTVNSGVFDSIDL